MSDKQRQPRRPDDAGPSSILVGTGAVLLAMVCCAAPALLAAGVLGAVGAWLTNPWVIGAALALLGGAVAWTLWRRNRAGRSGSAPDDCCDPPPADLPGPHRTDREDH